MIAVDCCASLKCMKLQGLEGVDAVWHYIAALQNVVSAASCNTLRCCKLSTAREPGRVVRDAGV